MFWPICLPSKAKADVLLLKYSFNLGAVKEIYDSNINNKKLPQFISKENDIILLTKKNCFITIFHSKKFKRGLRWLEYNF